MQARWYQRAAEGGSARAMYNLALCYRKGEGLIGDSHEARKWMKRAALAGHRKAQFEHGLTLFAVSMMAYWKFFCSFGFYINAFVLTLLVILSVLASIF